jgi:dihydrolipoamide dehydrogenase
MIKVDEHMQTNVFGLYAVGDCNGKLMLAHTAYRQAEVAVNSILGISDVVNYDAIPSVIYTSPEVAWVGLNSEQAKKRGIAFKEIVLPMEYSGRFVAENEGQSGVFKLLIDKRENTIIGAHAIANYSAEFIEVCTLMIHSRLKITELQQLTFPHPTVCEIIKEALMMV